MRALKSEKVLNQNTLHAFHNIKCLCNKIFETVLTATKTLISLRHLLWRNVNSHTELFIVYEHIHK